MIQIKSFGPVFYGHEYPVEQMVEEKDYVLDDQSWLTTSWMIEDQEPYRRSIWAFRVKVSKVHAIHMGLCRKNAEPPHRKLKNSPNEIGSWGRNAAVQEDAAEA